MPIVCFQGSLEDEYFPPMTSVLLELEIHKCEAEALRVGKRDYQIFALIKDSKVKLKEILVGNSTGRFGATISISGPPQSRNNGAIRCSSFDEKDPYREESYSSGLRGLRIRIRCIT